MSGPLRLSRTIVRLAGLAAILLGVALLAGAGSPAAHVAAGAVALAAVVALAACRRSPRLAAGALGAAAVVPVLGVAQVVAPAPRPLLPLLHVVAGLAALALGDLIAAGMHAKRRVR
ncbi:MAG TPA: hypothetical protein VIC57_12405 [Candidatus Dormibacteraeota bacterium]